MPKYIIDVVTTLEVETENVVQAKNAAEHYLEIGEYAGIKGEKNGAGVMRSASVVSTSINNPKRVRV